MSSKITATLCVHSMTEAHVIILIESPETLGHEKSPAKLARLPGPSLADKIQGRKGVPIKLADQSFLAVVY